MSTDTAISLLLTAGFVGVLGVLIKYCGHVHLIAGYDSESVTDTEGLAEFVGTNILYIAGISAAVAVAEYTKPVEGYELIWPLYVLGVVLITIRIIRGARTFESTR